MHHGHVFYCSLVSGPQARLSQIIMQLCTAERELACHWQCTAREGCSLMPWWGRQNATTSQVITRQGWGWSHWNQAKLKMIRRRHSSRDTVLWRSEASYLLLPPPKHISCVPSQTHLSWGAAKEGTRRQHRWWVAASVHQDTKTY